MEKKERYVLYSREGDITFIMQDIYEDDTYKATEVIGFHYGEPYDKSIADFAGKIRAEFIDGG